MTCWEAALAEEGPDEISQGQFAAAREGVGVMSQPCGLGEGIAADVLNQVAEQVRKGSVINTI